ncbi:MAG: LptF/LptG family permease [Synechococcales cyanobacterium]
MTWVAELGLWRGLWLERYLYSELIRPFFLGVGGGVTLLLGNQFFLYTELLVRKGAPPLVMLQILILNLPAILILTFPIAGLLATLLVLGRMGGESEITALRAAGVSYTRLMIPLLIMGVGISALAFGLNEAVVPYTNQKVRTLNENLINTADVLLLDEQRLFKLNTHLWFYSGELVRDPQAPQRRNQMRDVFLLDRNSEQGVLRYPQIITAERAIRNGSTWTLQGAVVRRFDNEGRTFYEGQVGAMNLHVPENLAVLWQGEKTALEQSTQELSATIAQLQADNASPDLLNRMRTEWHFKFAIPLSSFFAVLVAVPLGLKTVRRTGRYGGVAIAIILVFIYYVLLSLGRGMGLAGWLPPWFAAWLGNLLFAGIGSGLVWWMVR